MINLSPAQEKIVYATIGQPIQVLASAGSGKTRVLTQRVRHILENTKKEGVIALTFTNKAAEEMLSRLDDIQDIEERCWIATIHSVAQRILDQYGHTIGLPSELHIYERDQDRKTVFLQSLREQGIDIDTFLDVPDEKTRKDRERIVQNYMEQFSIVKRDLLSEEEIKQKYATNEKFWSIFQAYQQSLLESGGIDFDDILVYAHKILTEQTWCGQIYRAKYKHICVDEAQDLNKAQYEFIKSLCGEQIKSILMVGDKDQMIYGFNGSSDDYLIQNFINDFSPVKYKLQENYRSSKRVIHLANQLKPNSQTESEFAIEGIGEIQSFNDEQSEAEWIFNKINDLLNLKNHDDIEKEISLSNMVVIARNRFVFSNLEDVLSKNGITYSLNKGERQVEPSSLFGKVLDLAIRLKVNPKDWVHGKKLCDVLKISYPELWGDSFFNLYSFSIKAQEANIPFADIQAKLLDEIEKLDLETPNIPKLCSNFTETIKNLTVHFELEAEGGELERSIQELQDFGKCWTRFKSKGLGNSLMAFRNAMALGQLTEDYNPAGLTLSTVHTMKGLEKDIVFLMGMSEGVFPDYRARTLKEIEEEKNNAFVAITRAKRWIYITYPKQRKMPWGAMKWQSPSRFITQIQSKN